MAAKKEKSPAYRWYPKDALTSQRILVMSLAEEGAYRRALDYCWLNGSIPADPKECALVIGKSCTNEVAAKVLGMFIPDPKNESQMVHERLNLELRKQKEWAKKCSDGGKASRGKPKRKKGETTEQGSVGLVELPLQVKGNIPIPIPSSFPKEEKDIPSGISKKRKQTSVPDEFPITESMRTWAAEKAPWVLDVDGETEAFLDDRRSKSIVYGDWVAGWRTWLRNSKKFGAARTTGTATIKHEPKVICTQMTNFNEIPWVPVRHAGIVDDSPKPDEIYEH